MSLDLKNLLRETDSLPVRADRSPIQVRPWENYRIGEGLAFGLSIGVVGRASLVKDAVLAELQEQLAGHALPERISETTLK